MQYQVFHAVVSDHFVQACPQPVTQRQAEATFSFFHRFFGKPPSNGFSKYGLRLQASEFERGRHRRRQLDEPVIQFGRDITGPWIFSTSILPN